MATTNSGTQRIRESYSLEDYLNDAQTIRRRIIDASAALFRRRGFSIVTMNDIASAVNLSKAGLYHHCPSKDEILSDIVRLCAELLRGQINRVRTLELSAFQRLRAFVVTRMETIARHQDLFTIIWQERPFISTESFGGITKETQEYRADLRDMIERAKRSGALRRDADTHLLMLAIDGMTGWAYIWFREDGAKTPTEIGEAFWSFLAQGVAAEGTDAASSGEGGAPKRVRVIRSK